MRSLALVFLLAFSPACATTISVDAGADAGIDGPLPCQADATVPDAQTFISPTQPPHQNACTAQQVSDYAQCQGAKITSFCQEFKAGGSAAGCGACIETQHDAPDGGIATWGVVVFNGSTAFVNVEGCVNDALGQTDPTTSCGQALFDLYTCQATACSACTGPDFSRCELETLGDACSAQNTLAFSATGPCSALVGDAVPPDVLSCFPDTSITDSTQQEVDWLTRIVGYMCGP